MNKFNQSISPIIYIKGKNYPHKTQKLFPQCISSKLTSKKNVYKISIYL
jgi:hypothetical protein